MTKISFSVRIDASCWRSKSKLVARILRQGIASILAVPVDLKELWSFRVTLPIYQPIIHFTFKITPVVWKCHGQKHNVDEMEFMLNGSLFVIVGVTHEIA